MVMVLYGDHDLEWIYFFWTILAQVRNQPDGRCNSWIGNLNKIVDLKWRKLKFLDKIKATFNRYPKRLLWDLVCNRFTLLGGNGKRKNIFHRFCCLVYHWVYVNGLILDYYLVPMEN